MLKENLSIKETKRVMKARNPIITVVLLFILMQVPSLLIGLGYGIAKTAELTNSGITDPKVIQDTLMNSISGENAMLIMLYATILIIFVTYLFAKFFQKRNALSLGLTNKNRLINYIKGMAIGIIMISISVIILRALGAITLDLNIQNISFGMFILFFIGRIFQGFEEEFLCRSVLMNYFAANNGVVVGIIVNSLIFSLLHLGNAGFDILPFINIFLMGILFSLLFYISDDIFLPAAVHTFWNFFQGNVFGISVSGTFTIKTTILNSTLKGNEILTGGAFGVEGGLAVTIVEVIVIIILIKMIKDKGLFIKKDDTLVVEENII